LTGWTIVCYVARTLRRPRDLREGLRALAGPRVFQAVSFSGALALMTGVVAAGAACGPIEYVSQVSDKASHAVEAAKRAGAERAAPYEYTAAVAYLHKAREEGGYAEYQIAIEYGRRSEELAEKALAIAEKEGAAKSDPTSDTKSGNTRDATKSGARDRRVDEDGDDDGDDAGDDGHAAPSRPSPKGSP